MKKSGQESQREVFIGYSMHLDYGTGEGIG